MDNELLFGKLDTRDPKDMELMEKLLFEKASNYKEDFPDAVPESEKKAV